MKLSLVSVFLCSSALLQAQPTSHKCPPAISTVANTAESVGAAPSGTQASSSASGGIGFTESRQAISRGEEDVLALFAAYAGAAYTVSNQWNCPYACEYPGTQGTVIEHHWNIGKPKSAGYIARNPNGKYIIVAFQGTDSSEQWADNLNVVQVPWPDGIDNSKVHAGFLRGYVVAQDDILGQLKPLADKYPDYSIVIVGHSLGGARASLALLDISLKMPELLPRMYMYTVGQPRTGNREFANAIDALSVPKYRQVFEYDYVTRLPLVEMGYYHHSTEAWDHDNQTTLCAQRTKGDGCSSPGDLLHPLSVPDHFGYPGLKYK
ncbi:hypothetical protein GGF46_000592 [Coemansia sp. RSA 552]|nr:hypothetical protein GGF46_000592 [Coemansia sp. RSA 552]